MRITISPKDNVVSHDLDARPINTSALPQTILSIVFDTVAGIGVENHDDGSVTQIKDMTSYQAVLTAYDQWKPAAAV
jgi:hypothetical protein